MISYCDSPLVYDKEKNGRSFLGFKHTEKRSKTLRKKTKIKTTNGNSKYKYLDNYT